MLTVKKTWDQAFEENDYDNAISITQNSDERYVLAGTTGSKGA